MKRSETFLYEEEGDRESGNKNWKEAEKKYEQARENMKFYQKQYKASSHFFRKELRRATTQAQKEQCRAQRKALA